MFEEEKVKACDSWLISVRSGERRGHMGRSAQGLWADLVVSSHQ